MAKRSKKSIEQISNIKKGVFCMAKTKWNKEKQIWERREQIEGKRKYFSSDIKGTKGKQIVDNKFKEWKENRDLDPHITVEKFSETYLNKKQPKEGKSSSRYRNIKCKFNKWIIPHLGNKKMCNLVEQDFQDIIDFMDEKGLAYRTMSETVIIIEDFLRHGRKNGVTKLRLEGLEVNKDAPVYKRKSLQPDDIYTLFSSNKTVYFGKEVDDFFINAYRFFVIVGDRRGELIALEKARDFSRSFNGDLIKTIHHSINEYGELTDGKTDNSQRSQAVPTLGEAILEEQKKLLDKYHIKSKYVFPDKDGGFISPNKLWYRFKTYAEYNNLSVHTLHELRHTYVSLFKNELPEEILKQIIGHSKDTDTIGTYGHNIEGDLSKAKNKINHRIEEIMNLGKEMNASHHLKRTI